MKDINEIVSALIGGTLKESENIELKRTLPRDLPKIAKTLSALPIVEAAILFLE